ncbi:DnaA/Hda family protein [Coraliomargarita sp. SDUM461003]|uniref:DnaA/Hda family protein n=1 Tax=Thalassobacterium maritimum TaxID=3041265 RepID=A0ABU1AR88_9BACT|nr:hypothetical protein [Coraliomargarita sp. SDUM461003]MDQ8206678.1 DnaA/Hda family protein [Coraliomargarita sp. SDUM461003]
MVTNNLIDTLYFDEEITSPSTILWSKVAVIREASIIDHGGEVTSKVEVEKNDGSMSKGILRGELSKGDPIIVLPNGSAILGTEFSWIALRDAFEIACPIEEELGFYDTSGTPPSPKAYETLMELADTLHTRIEHHTPHPAGAYLHGASFGGKTTAKWHFILRWTTNYVSIELLNKRPIDKAVVIWVEADEFAEKAKNKAKFGQSMDWLNELSEVPILAIDDLDKLQISESVEVAFFGLIKRRIERRKFTIISSNMEAARFVNRFSIDRRQPILNRLHKFYKPIKFTRQTKQAEPQLSTGKPPPAPL